ncbi:MAG: PAS domain-containing protein [Alphaproteobacteria bacterium]
MPRPDACSPGARGSIDDPTLNCLHPVGNELVRHWRSLRPGDGFPSEDAVDPNAIRAILPHILMIDVVHNEPHNSFKFRYRLAGTEVTRSYGAITGKFVDEALRPAARERYVWVLDRVLGERLPLRNIGYAQLIEQRWQISEVVVLPLVDGDDINVMIGSIIRWYDDNPPPTVQEAWTRQAG